MKQLTVGLLDIYTVFLSPLLRQVVGQSQVCKYEISCSRYAKHMIQSEGIVKGLCLAARRVLSCR